MAEFYVGFPAGKFHMRIIEEHRKAKVETEEKLQKDEPKSKKETRDFVVLPGENGAEQMKDTYIKAFLQDMIAAVTDTSLVKKEWAMEVVIKHPQVLSKVQAELDTVVAWSPNQAYPTSITYDALSAKPSKCTLSVADFKILPTNAGKRKCPGASLGVVLLYLSGENGAEQMKNTDIKALIQDMMAATTDASSMMNE